MNGSIPLKQEVTEQLPWLIHDYGLRIVEDEFDPMSFGNSFVVLESPVLLIRFIRDRGQVFAEVASHSEPRNWFNLEHVCELSTGRIDALDLDLPSVGELLRINLPSLIELLGAKFELTKRELERRDKER